MNNIVVAYDKNRAIGADGDMPWAGRMRTDMTHFTDLTAGRTVIMGRRTYESIPERFRPLSHRQNIVVSLSKTSLQGVEVVGSLADAYSAAQYETFIIGVGQIYEQALADTDRIFATEIEAEVAGGDTYFPALSKDEWMETSRYYYPDNERNMYPFAFVTYLRKYRNNQ